MIIRMEKWKKGDGSDFERGEKWWWIPWDFHHITTVYRAYRGQSKKRENIQEATFVQYRGRHLFRGWGQNVPPGWRLWKASTISQPGILPPVIDLLFTVFLFVFAFLHPTNGVFPPLISFQYWPIVLSFHCWMLGLSQWPLLITTKQHQ